jgi:hypothetical protein
MLARSNSALPENSAVTVKLITGAVRRMNEDTTMGRAEALRQSMLSMIYSGSDFESHLAIWAPFIGVVEGATVK